MERLKDVKLSQDRKRVIYEHVWRSDFVGEALTMELENERQVVSLEFYSSEFGIVRWVRNRGFLPSHSWESDDSVSGTLHGQHYPSCLLNGSEPFSNTLKIVQDVLNHRSLSHLRDLFSSDSLRVSQSLTLPQRV